MPIVYGHPVYGASWEGFVIEQLLSHAHHWQASFYRTCNGAEVDLVLEKGREKIAIEIKSSTAPTLSKGQHSAVEDLNPNQFWVIANVQENYSVRNAEVLSLLEAIDRIRE